MRGKMKIMCVLLGLLLILGSLNVFAGGGRQQGGAVGSSTGKNWITATDISDMPQTTIRYWFYETPERIALGQKQIAEFMRKFPNITVQGSIAPDNTDNEMLMPYIQSRTNSNVHQSVCIEDTWYFTNGLLYPLNNFPDFRQFMARFNPDLNYTWKDGNTYSISWYTTHYVMVYNKRIMEEIGWDPAKPPQTYSEYYDFARRVTRPGRYALWPWIGEEWWRWQGTVYPFYIAATGSNQLVNTNGKTAMFNNPNGVKALEFYETLFRNRWAPAEAVSSNPFIIGTAASAMTGAGIVREVMNDAPPGFDYVVAPIPIPDGNTKGRYDTLAFTRTLALIDELGVPEGEARDRVRRASWEFLKFLLSDEQGAADFAATGEFPTLVNPTSNSILKPVYDSYGPKMADVVKLSHNAVIYDMNTYLACEVLGTLAQAYARVMHNQMNAAQAMAWAEGEANKILAAGN